MTDFKFATTERKDSAKAARSNGMIPAVIYGNDYKNQNLCLEEVGFARLYKEAGTSNLVDLKVADDDIKVLIHDVQHHPVSGKILHVDFYKVNMKEKIKTEIPLEFTGESTLVIDQEGSFIVNRDHVEVECLPSDLVDHINVDISGLTDFEQNIKVADLKIPEGLEILDDSEEVVALVQPPRSEEELEALDEAVVEDVEAVEVEEHGKEEEEGEEGAEGEEKSEDGEKLIEEEKKEE
jgi:large subunit ribosomal protein L25